MPSACALRVISLANVSSSPAIASATTTAASLAERVTIPLMASSTLMVCPSRKPSLVGDCTAADQQVTTARDQALLGRAIHERFPHYYKYFSTRSFEFRGEEIGNHNRLLGSVEGVDGIKTGYIAASGFNLVTSVHRDNRFLLAVVFGGSSAGSRDERMRELIRENIAQASVQHTATMVAD